MNENPTATDWAAARGEKWRAQLAGMEAMLTPVDEPLIRALNLDAPCRIVDIGCGGGGTTLEILRRAPAGSVVHGFDISPALSRKRSDERAIAFEIADMATVTARMGPNDRLVSRFDMTWWPKPSIRRRAIPKCRAVSLLTPTSYSSGSIRAALMASSKWATGAHCSRSAMAARRESGEFRIRRTACRSW